MVDQLLTSIDRTEKRRGPYPQMTGILPDFYVDLDLMLDELVRVAAQTPMTHRWIDGVIGITSPTDARGYVRWVGRPDLGVEIEDGWQDHVTAARLAAPRRVAKRCDRCGSDEGEMLLTLALAPPHLVVIALDGTCVDQLDVREFTFEPR